MSSAPNFVDLESRMDDPRSSIPNDIHSMALNVADWRELLRNPTAVETLRDQIPQLDCLATDIFNLIHEVSND